MGNKPILVRVTTVDISLWKLLEGQLSFMSEYFDVYGVSSPGDKLDVVASRENIKIYPIHMTRGISPLGDLVSIWKMYKYFKYIKPTIVHSHTPKAGLVAMLAGMLAKVPIKVHTIAGLPLESRTGIKRRILSVVEKVVYHFADKVYPNSNGLKEFVLKGNLCPSNKLKIIGKGSSNGIDLDHFKKTEAVQEEGYKSRKNLGISENDFVFLFIGRIVKDKGIEQLAVAFDKIQKSRKDVKLVLLGRKEDHLDPISQEANQIMDTNNHIIYTGYQLDIRPYLALADCFVFPTFREGLPNVLLQACAFNLPIIASKVTGNTDIIVEGVNGLFFEAGNSDSLLEKMQIILNNDKVRDSLAIDSRRLVKEKYNRNFVWQSILSEYKSLLNEARLPYFT